MDSLESDILDYARAKGGWFTNSEVREHLGIPNSKSGKISAKLKSLVKYGFLIVEPRYTDPNSGKWYVCNFYKDAEVECRWQDVLNSHPRPRRP